jgi:hypothetical protein
VNFLWGFGFLESLQERTRIAREFIQPLVHFFFVLFISPICANRMAIVK